MPKIIWIDLETTGLDPKHNCILEVAALESSTEDPFNARPIYEAVLKYPRAPNEGQGKPIEDLVWRMHEKSGLWERCRKSELTKWDVEKQLAAAIGPAPEKYGDYPILAGNSVWFDRGFMHNHLPFVETLFHHRHYDVSSIKMFCRQLGMPHLHAAEAHTAMADILESVDHARACHEWVQNAESRVIEQVRARMGKEDGGY